MLDWCGLVPVGVEPPTRFQEQILEVLHPLRGRKPRDRSVVVLALHVSSAQPQLRPAAGEQVQGGHLAGQQCGVPEAGVEHVRPQAKTITDRDGRGQSRERAMPPR